MCVLHASPTAVAIFILTLWLWQEAGHNLTLRSSHSLNIDADKMQPNLVGIFQGMRISTGLNNSPTRPPPPPLGATNHQHSLHAEGQANKTISRSRLKAILQPALALHPSPQIGSGPVASLLPVPLVFPNPSSKVLAVSPMLPAKMHREDGQWKLSDFNILDQLYKASRVCEGLVPRPNSILLVCVEWGSVPFWRV